MKPVYEVRPAQESSQRRIVFPSPCHPVVCGTANRMQSAMQLDTRCTTADQRAPSNVRDHRKKHGEKNGLQDQHVDHDSANLPIPKLLRRESAVGKERPPALNAVLPPCGANSIEIRRANPIANSVRLTPDVAARCAPIDCSLLTGSRFSAFRWRKSKPRIATVRTSSENGGFLRRVMTLSYTCHD
jgi:hypothetical protein